MAAWCGIKGKEGLSLRAHILQAQLPRRDQTLCWGDNSALGESEKRHI